MDTFIKKANKKHKNKYDYSLVKYKNNKTKIKIICTKHGIFEQRPDDHLNGHGCSKCSKNHKKTTEEFVQEVIKIYGNKYNYSLVEYKNNKTKIKIICPEHGIFEQTPINFLNGKLCKKCNKNFLTIDLFIEKSCKIHGNKYDYSLVEYKNKTQKIKIICPEHGIFKMSPKDHLRSRGCYYCNNKIINKKQFINEAKKIHDNKYDYLLVNYINKITKIKIICKKHGIFEQKPYSHLAGSGCQICNNSHGENEISKILNNYNIKYENQKRFKECKHKKTLPFDFYLPELNICIEYDGRQHFEPVNSFGGYKEFLNIKKRDSIKNIFCKKENIKLIRISYKEKNIKKIILNEIKKPN